MMLGWEHKKGLDVSVLELVREVELSFRAPRNKIIGGNDQLPHKMANDLSHVIRYNHKVVDLGQDDTGVNVVLEENGQRT